jgi:hypothetical protein
MKEEIDNLAADYAREEKEWKAAKQKFDELNAMEIIVTKADIERAAKFVTGADHDEVCFVCGKIGILIMCDSCPACAHAKCVGLTDEVMDTDDDWFCATCSGKIANVCPVATPLKEGGEGEGQGGEGVKDGDAMQED